ncbi:trypsin-like peptidase domain-containing protein, partial [Aliarcobacter butzleri]|uniref:trypsin-like peptidase domain-containing protein n=1 Tax=Aliarcobacter butzleri TaxID=28197 RepID=UPI0019D5A897
KVNADLVGADSATDLAVLKINATNVKTVASFGNSNSIVPGQDVLAIGSPMGSEYANTVTKGIISAKDRTLETASEGSGVIYKKSGNSAYVVTNNHVVKGSNALQVILSNGKKVNADLVGADSATDLAVLKINATNVKTVASFG